MGVLAQFFCQTSVLQQVWLLLNQAVGWDIFLALLVADIADLRWVFSLQSHLIQAQAQRRLAESPSVRATPCKAWCDGAWLSCVVLKRLFCGGAQASSMLVRFRGVSVESEGGVSHGFCNPL